MSKNKSNILNSIKYKLFNQELFNHELFNQKLFKNHKCCCGSELGNLVEYSTFFANITNWQRIVDWVARNSEQINDAMTLRERDRLLLPRIDARINNLAMQLKRLEKKYQLPDQRVSAGDLVAFGIKYPLSNRVYDYQFQSPRHSPVRDLDGELCGDQEFIQISHSYEPRLYDVRFYLEREIDFAVWQYNRIDRRNYFKDFRYDLLRLLPKGFPVRDHFHCLVSSL